MACLPSIFRIPTDTLCRCAHFAHHALPQRVCSIIYRAQTTLHNICTMWLKWLDYFGVVCATSFLDLYIPYGVDACRCRLLHLMGVIHASGAAHSTLTQLSVHRRASLIHHTRSASPFKLPPPSTCAWRWGQTWSKKKRPQDEKIDNYEMDVGMRK